MQEQHGDFTVQLGALVPGADGDSDEEFAERALAVAVCSVRRTIGSRRSADFDSGL
jgi:hypothetical protein